jgi:DNA-binding MarR family transcriptional regulator
MNTTSELIETFHNEMVELIKKYQFRDRNEMVCCGISVSQCYTLETLYRFGPLSMQNLANKMHLSISTMTRVINPLVEQGLISREEDRSDHRVRVITLTDSGKEKFLQTWDNVFKSEKSILENFPENQRESLIEFLKKLNKAFGYQNESCCPK